MEAAPTCAWTNQSALSVSALQATSYWIRRPVAVIKKYILNDSNHFCLLGVQTVRSSGKLLFHILTSTSHVLHTLSSLPTQKNIKD